MLAPIYFNPSQPASNARALAALPIDPNDLGANGGVVAGTVFTRTHAFVPTRGVPPLLGQDTDPAVLAAAYPPDDPAAAIAYLAATDSAIQVPVRAPPTFVDLMFTSNPARALTSRLDVRPDVRLIVRLIAFFFGTGTMFGTPAGWAAIGHAVLLGENERARLDWFAMSGRGDGTATIPDALSFWVLVPSGRKMPPADYTFAAVAAFV